MYVCDTKERKGKLLVVRTEERKLQHDDREEADLAGGGGCVTTKVALADKEVGVGPLLTEKKQNACRVVVLGEASSTTVEPELCTRA